MAPFTIKESLNPLPDETSPLIITDKAASKIHELLLEEGDPEQRLRIAIKGGGCSGFQYNFSFDQQAEDDILVERSLAEDADIRVGIAVDMLSLECLEGATIDYKNDINGERFVIINPKAKSTCGCGSSFDM